MSAAGSLVRALPVRNVPAVELEWADPPPAQWGPASQNEALAAALRARPGQWAIVRTYPRARVSAATNFAQRIRVGAIAAFVNRDFEAVARTVDDEARVYARYIGGAK